MKFSVANTKLKKLYKYATTVLKRWLGQKIGRSAAKVYSFDILSGVDCPFAHNCKSQAEEQADGSRRIKDGPHTKFRCFSASQEVLFTNVYKSRKANHDAIHSLETSDEIADALCDALPKDARIIRIHVSGDFFNLKYLLAWIMLAKKNPHILFYAYTKSLPYWSECSSELQGIPNLVLTASYGGRHDGMIAGNFRSAKVVFSQEEADKRGLIIDSDDSHAAVPEWRNNDFALLIHGTQPKGSESGKALVKIKRANKLKKELAK